MSKINSIITQIEDLGETSKTVNGITKNLKELFSEVTEEEKQAIMKEIGRRRIKYTEKQKSNLMHINYFIATIKCKTEEEIENIFKERKKETKKQKTEAKEERKREERKEEEQKKIDKEEKKKKEKEEKEIEKKAKEERKKKEKEETEQKKRNEAEEKKRKEEEHKTSEKSITPEIIPIKAKEKVTPPIITLVIEPKEEINDTTKDKENTNRITEKDIVEEVIPEMIPEKIIDNPKEEIITEQVTPETIPEKVIDNTKEEGITAEKISEALNEEEKKQLKKAVKNKTPKEIKDTIKKNKDPMIRKIIKKIGISVGILAVTGGIIRAIWTRAQKDAKNKRIYENEQTVDQKKKDNNTGARDQGEITPPPQEKFTTEKLQQSIAQEKLQGVTYENIMNAVESIANPKIKKQVVDLLKGGDIVGLQELYGMKVTSEYSSNKAKGLFDKITLNKIKNPFFGLAGQEIVDNENIPQEVKEIYKEFVIGQIPNGNLAYLILSKNTCKQYLFDKNNQLIDIQPILIGADLGNKGEFMPYEYYKVTGNKKIYVRGKINRNTPTGMFKVKKTIDLGANYKVDGPKRGINIVPIDPQGNEEERFKYKQWGLAIHPIYQPQTNPEKYEKAIESGSTQDNSITHGCPNIEGFGIVFDQLGIGSKVYICTE